MTTSQLRPAAPTADADADPLAFAGQEPNGTAAEAFASFGQPLGPAGWVAAGLEATLQARLPRIHATTPLVRRLADRAASDLGLDRETRELLEIAVRVRDIGMIALPDAVVLATAALSPSEWACVNRHPEIGAELLERLSVVAPAAALVRAHHERWDGGGYPDGCSGKDIPLLSRIISTCDAFAATATDRPYRRALGPEAAIELIHQESGTQFDPATVDALDRVLRHPRPKKRSGVKSGMAGHRAQQPAAGSEPQQFDLRTALAAFDVVPALAPAVERVLKAIGSDTPAGSELVSAVEGDMGLTVAVMRFAQEGAGVAISSVPDAVIALGSAGIAEAVKGIPRAAFPWRTTPLEAVMHRALVHAQAVARATDRIARELRLTERDELLVAALLHDVGKLALGRAVPGYNGAIDRTATPETRAREEQRLWGLDHATLGGVLIRRWGLSKPLADRVATHHRADSADDIATLVRLADMAAHHALGDAIDHGRLLKLAGVCGVSATALREILFDLPHAGGSQRRRAEPSPLSPRETLALRSLAEGMTYKATGLQQGKSTSTIRTQMHTAYRKLGVSDRAQAVLRATEMGWI